MEPLNILLIVVAVAGFYLLIIRPNQQRQKKQQQLVSQLGPGVEVMTTAGIMGTIAVVTDDEISLEISPGVYMRVVPQAIARVVDPPGPETEEPGDVD